MNVNKLYTVNVPRLTVSEKKKNVPNGKEILRVQSMCADTHACTVHPPQR